MFQIHLPSSPSLKWRYAAKLSTNLVGMVVGLGAYVFISRGLGPSNLGDFSFLTRFFISLTPLFTLYTSNGFFTKLSQRQEDFSFVSFYFQFTLVSFVFLFLFVTVSGLTDLDSVFWPGQDIKFVYMACIFGVLTHCMDILTKTSDAYGLTVSTEIAKIGQKGIALALIASLYFMNQLTLFSFFLYHFTILTLLVVTFLWIIKQKQPGFPGKRHIDRKQIRSYGQELYSFSHPLVVYGIISMFSVILDRWLLQKFGGSFQQGLFSFSYQIGAISLIFTTAMTSLITREFSIVAGIHDLKAMKRLFRLYIPLLFSITAYFSCFASVQAAKIIHIFGGQEFDQAGTAFTIIALYPIHQTYGQLSASVFFASAQTKLYRNIGVIFVALGLAATYVVLAPKSMLGLNLGAAGLAAKFVGLQLFTTNVQLYFNAKYLDLRLSKYVGHQILCVGLLFITAYLSKFVVDSLDIFKGHIIIGFFISGVLYSALVVILLWFVPIIFGLSRENVKEIITKIMSVRQRLGSI